MDYRGTRLLPNGPLKLPIGAAAEMQATAGNGEVFVYCVLVRARRCYVSLLGAT